MVGSGIGGKGGVAGDPRYEAMKNPSAPMPETPSHAAYQPSSTVVMRNAHGYDQPPMPNARTPSVYDPAVKSASPAAYQPLAPQGDFNVNNAAAGGLQQAMHGTQAAMAGPNVGAFMNPYTSMVTGTALNDLERQRQMMTNTTGAQATQAGAFGGSRHGVADALTNEAFAREGSQMFSNLQQQGYNNALNAAQNQQNIQMSGAAQMGQLGNQAFNTGRSIQQDQATQGLLQQGVSQALIDAAKGQFANYANAPAQSLGAPLAALGSTPNQSTETTSSQPGLLNYLSAGLSISDVRLKKNVKPAGEISGVKFYNWDWNEEGKRIADPTQKTFGVIADELRETHPHLVKRGEDGYLRVNYTGLSQELEAA